MRSFDGLRACSRECVSKKKECKQKECRMFIDFKEDYNCTLISIYTPSFFEYFPLESFLSFYELMNLTLQ